MLAGKSVMRPRSPRALFWNDVAVLAGSIFGPMVPLITKAAEQKDRVTAGIVAAVSVAVFIGGLVARRRFGRRWAFSGICLVMGAFSAGVLVLKNPEWTAAGLWKGVSGAAVAGYAPAAIYLALYWCIGLALFLTLEKRDAAKGR